MSPLNQEFLSTSLLFLILIVKFVEFSNCYCSVCSGTTGANFCDNYSSIHNWIIEDKEIAPDNYKQIGKVINGNFPGPTLIVSTNSYLVVKVINKSPENITIHWHGLHQEKTVVADGVPFVTQYPISPMTNFTYCIYIGNQTGTYMYHGHYGLDIVSIHGPLIIKDPTLPTVWNPVTAQNDYAYDGERILWFAEWFHNPLADLLNDMLNKGARIEPKSLLINGKSYGIWSNSTTGSEDGYTVINVRKGRTYRFRIINLAADQMLQFYIAGHKMCVIEMDGIYTEPVEVDYVQLHSGQRFSVLVKINQNVDNYWMDIRVVPGPGPRNGAAILHYINANDPGPLRKTVRSGKTDAIAVDQWIANQLNPTHKLIQYQYYPVPQTVQRNILIDYHLVSFGRSVRFTIDGNIYQEPNQPYLLELQDNKNIINGTHVFEIISGQNIQVIFQNRPIKNCTSCVENHPWHMHGRFFHVVASGPDLYDPKRDDKIINEAARAKNRKFQFRDVFVQYPLQSGKQTDSIIGCGWYAIRFRANNPGLWLNHCHITSHMLLGKMFLIWEHTKDNPTLIGE